MKNARKEPTDENEKDMFFAYTTFVTPNTLTPIHHSACAHSVLACRRKKEEKRSNKNKLIAQKSNKIIKKKTTTNGRVTYCTKQHMYSAPKKHNKKKDERKKW